MKRFVFSCAQIIDQFEDFFPCLRREQANAILSAAVAGFVAFLKQTLETEARVFVCPESSRGRFGINQVWVDTLRQGRLQLHGPRCSREIFLRRHILSPQTAMERRGL